MRSSCITTRLGSTMLFSGLMAMLSLAPDANAQSVESFYKGKSIAIVIGYAPGGTYDATARLLARHMGRHIPGEPTMVPQTMAGSMRMTQLVVIAADSAAEVTSAVKVVGTAITGRPVVSATALPRPYCCQVSTGCVRQIGRAHV